MTWGVIARYDAKKAEDARQLPANQAEMAEWFPWMLNKCIKYDLQAQAKYNLVNGTFDAAAFAAVKAYAASPVTEGDNAHARAAANLVLEIYPKLNKAVVTLDELIGAAKAEVDALWEEVDSDDPTTLSTAEVDRIEGKNAALGYFAREGQAYAAFLRGSRGGWVTSPDPRVTQLKTANEFLAYNVENMVFGASDAPAKPIALSDAPKSVRQAAALLERRLADLEGKIGPERWKGGGVRGIYEVHRSPGDDTVVGYALTARAYHGFDGMTQWSMAVSLSGKVIVDEEETGP